MIENVFFIRIEKEIIKHFAKKSFSVFGGLNGKTQKEAGRIGKKRQET